MCSRRGEETGGRNPIGRIDDDLRSRGAPERAAKERAYLRDDAVLLDPASGWGRLLSDDADTLVAEWQDGLAAELMAIVAPRPRGGRISQPAP